MTEWIREAIETLGYLGIVLLTLLENVWPPLPSEVIMPLAGFTASRGDLSVIGTVFAGAIGSLAGTTVYYAIGRRFGEERARRWVRRHGFWLGATERDFDKATRWFQRRGHLALLVCRLIPGLRSLISLPAGLARLHPAVYFIYSAIGVAIWTGALTYAGVALGEGYRNVDRYLGPVSAVVVGAMTIGFVVKVVRRRRQKGRPLSERGG